MTLESERLTKLSNTEIADIVDSYKYFLWMFHESQFNFRERRQRETEFDTYQVKKRIEALERILRQGIYK